ncbi:helix-turn-helix domain-containing protein [Erythrobacter sp. THAF29]|uniref:AraC family transcriptional regulator n=1 Tax=Erythrobacter sp. THAF29 TaxID=2587851 RepID=UPI001268E203|nr:helix-turn-helix domain-containing protein [Erythrobacter sp. THAF29]QFT76179.1 Helix-turn-helix domain protein [Erythrobacter sp. THAF29]
MGSARSRDTAADMKNGESEPPFDSVTGATQEGTPLSLNRQPDERLRPWVGRSMVAYAYTDSDEIVHGHLCNDMAYLRTAVGVDWVAGTADGPLDIRDETFLCGQHTRVMPMSYRGGIRVAGLMLRPGALRLLFGLSDEAMIDRICSIEQAGISDPRVTGLHRPDIPPEQWLEDLESWLISHIERNEITPPDPISRALELQAFADPNCELRTFAEGLGVSPRTVERVARRDFGMSPKAVMRRARILDLASQLCGVADEQEEEDFMLRFFDQAHQIREFQAFFGMTPRQFQAERSGLLTLSLEIRQARRLEMLDRIEPDSVRPWMRKPFALQGA